MQKIIDFLKRLFNPKASTSPNSPISTLHNSINETALESTSKISVLEPVADIENIHALINPEQLRGIITTLPESKCKEYLPHLLKVLAEFEINTPIRIAAFIAQTAHESAGYSIFQENLNYSAQALLNIWPRRFTPESAAIYARQPEKIANHVYGGRIDLGNGDEASGDGWKYRGRGVMQITGRNNYKSCGIALGLDLLGFPELLEQPLNAFRSAGLYWKNRNCNKLADIEDFLNLTKAINGGTNGLADREVYYNRAKSVLEIA